MRLVSYNIRKAVGLDWRRDPGRVVDVLAEIDADIVVLQEADKRMGKRAGVLPLERLQQMGYDLAEVAIRPASHGWHGNAILYRGLRLAHAGRVELPMLEPRGAVRAQFHGLAVIGAHLGLTRAIRRRQIDALCAAMDGPSIIAGDFNEWAAELPASAGQVLTPGPSFHAARPVATLDRFIVSGITPKHYYVHHCALAARASDHLPVVLEFDPQGAPA